jgi:hypothetical protein
MSRESEFPGTLEDVIRKYGAPNTLISDMAKSEISRRVKDLLSGNSALMNGIANLISNGRTLQNALFRN